MAEVALTPCQHIRALTAPLLDRNRDVVLTGGKYLCLQSIGHIARQIRIYNRPSRGYFTLEWRLSELYILGEKVDYPAYGRSVGMVGRSHRFKPPGQTGLWSWDDPTMAGDFVDQIEAEILPLMRSLDTADRIISYILSQEMWGYSFQKDHIWMCFTHAVLGEFAMAKKRWDMITPSYRERCDKQMALDGLPMSDYFRSCLAVGEALKTDDHVTLAKLLWGNERNEADLFKLGRHWQPTAFPFQKTAKPLTAAGGANQQ